MDTVQPNPLEWDLIAGRWSLSARERKVIHLLVAGRSRKQVAHQLGMSLSTLQTHWRRALAKTGAADLVALIWQVVAARDALRPDGLAPRRHMSG
jgi:DNA-binding CsgD family transcriptional regulator